MHRWYKTCGAELKAWVASVIWWCLGKSQSFEQFYQNNVDSNSGWDIFAEDFAEKNWCQK